MGTDIFDPETCLCYIETTNKKRRNLKDLCSIYSYDELKELFDEAIKQWGNDYLYLKYKNIFLEKYKKIKIYSKIINL